MGLQVWLPLKGNLENKGLSKVTLTTSGTPTIEDGKIGQCYTFNEDSYFVSTESFLEGATQYSLCCWFKSDYDGTAWKRIISLGNHTRVQLDISPTTQKVRFLISKDGTSSVYSGVNSTTLCYDGQWHHVCGTFDNGKIKLYIDGVLEGSATGDATTYTATGGQRLAIGAVTNGGGMFKGSINDVRIYDECLSPMQVKLISQGLVGHYLLNNNGIPNNPNLLKKQIKESAWSLWGYGDATREKVTIGNKVWAHVIQNNTTRYDGYSINPDNNGIVTDQNHQYIISFMAKRGNNQPNSEIVVWWHWRSTEGGANIAQNSIRVNISDDTPHRYSCVISKCTDTTYDVNRINIMMGSYKANNEIYFTDVKFEEGDVATPWIPNEEDAEYTALGFNDNTEYDVSGYCNNGTKYNITDYTSDTPRYSVATKFNSNVKSYINIGRGGMVRDEITVNIWGYMDDWTKYNGRLISCTEGGGWNFEPSSSKIHFAIGTGTTSNTYKSTSGYALADLTSGWHMFTGTYDGFVTKQYVDGVLNTSYNAYTIKTPIFYHASNPILIGTEASSTQNPANYYFNGYMSDVRIYATALSESDIQSLYNNSAFLDSSGNIYATEYTES